MTWYNKWNRLISESTKSSLIPLDVQKKILESYNFIQGEFGVSYLNTLDKKHALHEKLYIKTSSYIAELIEFAKTLETLKATKCNYDDLLKKLRGIESSRMEGIPLVQLSTLLLNVGLLPKFEPQIPDTKKPDLEIYNPLTREIIYGEMTVLKDGDERNQKRNEYNFLFELIERYPPYFSYACKQKSYLGDHRSQVQALIIEAKQQMKGSSTLKVFENEYILLAMCGEEHKESLRDWAIINECYYNQIKGLELNIGDSERIIRNKIPEKAKQIPNDHNGVIFIKVNPLFFLTEQLENFIELAHYELGKYQNIIGMFLYGDIILQQKSSFTILPYGYIAIKQTHETTSRFTIFVHNKNVICKIKDDTYGRILRMGL